MFSAPEARADGALLDDLHRRGERAGAQQQREVVRFRACVMHAGDLDAAAEISLLDHRRGDHLALALLDQQDRHALADVLARDLLEDARARCRRGVMCTAGSLVWLSKPGCASVMRSPVSTTCFFTSTGAAVALDVVLGAEGHLAARAPPASACRVHRAPRRPCALRGVAVRPRMSLALRGVLHARQLHHDAVGALLLDDRLGHAELVDAVAQRR